MALDERTGVWKSGRGKGRRAPKGRQLDNRAWDEVREILGNRPRRRDLLIEHLHLIQDRFGHLSSGHLRALAEEMRLSMAEVYEVATFYAHFDVVKEGENPPPALTIRVCDSLSCELAGASELRRALQEGLDPEDVRVLRAPCMGRCDTAPVLEIGHNHIDRATPAKVRAAIASGDTHAHLPVYEEFDAYSSGGGYRTLAELRSAGDFETVQQLLLDAGIRGLGGAGFPAGRKWDFVPRRTRSALPGGQRGRGRAGHVQGPPLSRAGTACVPRGHADRRMGDRGRNVLHIHARRIPGRSRNSATRNPEPGERRHRRTRPHRPAAGCRRIHLRRRIGDDRIDRGQARAPASPPAFRRPGRRVRATDSREQCRDAPLGGQGPAGRRRHPFRRRKEWSNGPSFLLGLRPGQESGRASPARGLDDERCPEGLRRHGGGARVQGVPTGWAVGRAAPRHDGRHSARFRRAPGTRHLHRVRRDRRAVAQGPAPGTPRSTCSGSSRTRVADSARPVASAAKRPSS